MSVKKALLTLITLAVVGVFAFAGGGTEDTGTTPDEQMGGSTNESPMLAEMVAAGDLPPLEERLPENPLGVEPRDRVGEYGGEL